MLLTEMPAEQWPAKWVSFSPDPRGDLGVFAFRCKLNLGSVPDELVVRISADQRYKLYVGSQLVEFGPQRGDERHWFYETVDLAPYLKEGENLIWAYVWNFGWLAPMAQHTVRTGFVVHALDEAFSSLRTPGTWEVACVDGWDFAMMHSSLKGFYIDIGPGEIVDFGKPTDAHGDLSWRSPHVVYHAEDRGAGGGGTPWMLIPRSLPSMRYEERNELPKRRFRYRVDSLEAAFRSPHWSGVSDKSEELVRNGDSSDAMDLCLPLELQQGESILLDYLELLCAYPRLRLEGTPGTVLKLTYSEALWHGPQDKGHRDTVRDKFMRGYQDKVVLGSGVSVFEPLWWRTYRYLLIECEASSVGEATCQLLEIDAVKTGYPYEVESSFTADDPWVQPIWDVSVRTAKRCAGETYFDCPYYEQLQYVGDTRIQALIGYYLGRDRALTRNAVETLGWSIMDNGLTQSRYPSRQTQVIPPFSLWWMMMLYDQWLYDAEIWHMQEFDADRGWLLSLPNLQSPGFWNFGDWVPNWRWGVPPGDALSTVHQLTYRLSNLSRTLRVHGKRNLEENQLHALETQPIPWGTDILEGLVRHQDDPAYAPSEHSEALYRTYQAMTGATVDPWPTEALEKADAAKCTYYFSYYKHLAKAAAALAFPSGKGEAWSTGFDYMAELQPWKEMIEDGLTTFAENPEPVRSDCHAWSAHPILGFFQIVAGVTSVAPSWKRARIAPQPGLLKRFDARIAHPDGEMRVTFEDEGLSIDTPVPAKLVWRGKTADIPAGSHRI